MSSVTFSPQRFLAIIKKERMHVLRDPFVMMLALLLPFLVVILLGYSIEFNLKNISMVVVDHDHSLASQRLVESFGSSSYFLPYYRDNPQQLFDEIVEERAKVGIFIPPGFARHLELNSSEAVQVMVDGADNSSISAVINYLNTMQVKARDRIRGFDTRDLAKTTSPSPVTIVERYLFNPELNSKWFAIPGLGAVVIAVVAILLTTLTICKEWEHGSMELLMSTPVSSSELMLGKIVPYAILAAMGFLVVYLTARLLFHVPVRGGHLALAVFTMLFIVDYLGVGLYISVTTKEQQLAVQKALIIGLLPTSMLSGFIFPIKYMPKVLQLFTMIFPARWYVDAVRGIFLHGNAFIELLKPLVILGIQGVAILYAAIRSFKRSLE